MARTTRPATAPITRRKALTHRLVLGGRSAQYWDFMPTVVRQGEKSPTLFFVHGFRGDHHGLLRLAEELPQYRIIIADLPGFGASEPFDGTHDVDAYARFVRQSLDALTLDPRCVVLGHSYGSVIAAAFAASNPQRIDRLILVNPICEPALGRGASPAARLARAYYKSAERLPERFGMLLLTNPVVVRVMSVFMAKTREPVLRRYIHDQHARYFSSFANRGVLLEAFHSSSTGSVRESAAGLHLPVLLVAAERDDIGSVDCQRKLAAAIPSARLEVLPDTGHLVHYEKPAEAASLITDFLSARRP